jgi:hypothetical protein
MTLTGNTLFITGGSGIGLVLGGLRRVAVRFGGVRASTEFQQTRATFGTFPASYQVGFGGYAVHPEGAPSWKIRGAIVLLLPRRR